MKPLFILFLLPLLIGFLCERFARHARMASLTAALVTTVMIWLALDALDPAGTWNWLVTLLVLPLPIALSLFAVQIAHGRAQSRKQPMRKLGA